MKEKLIFLVDLANITVVTKETMPKEEEPRTFNEVWNYPNSKL